MTAIGTFVLRIKHNALKDKIVFLMYKIIYEKNRF